ncbi:MAG: response regulator [Candidatus Omnitrophica bacterium]|nr:response regulator [Candidatus Omnitrophota bacterium]
MNKKTIVLKIFFFCEVVIMLRILLFEIPVLMDQFNRIDTPSRQIESYFIIFLLVVAVAFVFSGLAGALRNQTWKLLHITASVITAAGTVVLWQAQQSLSPNMPSFYFVPLVYALFVLVVIFIYRKCSLEEDNIMKKVLIVDDDLSIHKMLDPILATNGYAVLSAMTGEEGLQMAQEHKPDIIILDVILPGMKGRAVCTAIKKNPAIKDIPVLFLTSKDSPDDVQAELEAGGIGHLTKPINPQYLVAQIKRVLG